MKKLNNFSKYCLRSSLAFAGLLITYMIVKRDFSQANNTEILYFILYYILPVILFSVVCLVISFIQKPIQFVGLIYIGAFMFGVFSAEFYLQYSAVDYVSKITKAAKERDMTPDLRKKEEVVLDLSKVNDDPAYPFLRIVNQFEEILPLGLIPNKLTVYCNEIGKWFVFKSDNHGFNNPNHVWEKKKIDMVALGDSFTHGACIPDNKNFVNLIRKDYPSIINLGIGGNNPLSNLASLIEYAYPKKPKIILWFHFAGNDLSGMMNYKDHVLYNKYLSDNNFSQNLLERSKEIEEKMISFFLKNKDEVFKADKKADVKNFNYMHLLKLHYLRNAFGQSRNLDGQCDFSLFENIMKKSKSLADKIDSKIYFINIPTLHQAFISDTDPNRRKTFDIISKLGIEWLDFSKLIINHNDPSSLYANRYDGGHFSELGNRLMAKFVLDSISLNFRLIIY